MEQMIQGATLHKTVCMLCFQVCGIHAYVKGGRLVGVRGMPEHPFSRGVLCPRGLNLPEYVHSPDRLTHPLKRKNGSWERISWMDALDTIAAKLDRVKQDYGAHALAVSVGSIGAENIAISAFAQRFRGAFGTPNYFSIEAHCFRTRIMARLMTFGTYPLEDPDRAKCIVLWGHNPDASEPPLAERIRSAVERGARLIVVDPKRIPLAEKGLHVQPRPGTDAALALSMMHVVISEGLYDKLFVEKYATGFDRLVQHVRDYPPEKAAAICGIHPSEITLISRVYAGAESVSLIQGINSLDQHINGFQNSRALAILQAITGNYDIPGGWATNPFIRLTDLRIPVEEEPIGADQYPLFRRFWNMTAPYGQQMLLPEVILSAEPYPIKAMIVSGGNPVASWPDSEKTARALSRLDLLVVMDLFMTDTARLAHIILPACSSLEMLGLAYNYGLTGGMPFVMQSKKIIEPLGESRPDWVFFADLGRRMGYGALFPWKKDEEVVEHLLKASGISLRELQVHSDGIWYGQRCYDINDGNQIRTPSGRIEIFSQTLADAGYDPIPVHREPSQSPLRAPGLTRIYPLILVTGSRMKAYTHWQMRDIPSLRRLAPRPLAEIHRDTAGEYNISDGDRIVVETRKGEIEVVAALTPDMKPGVVNLHHGWGESVNQNLLTELDPRDPVTGYPELRSLACRIRRAEEPVIG